MSNVSLKLRQRAEVMAILKKYRDNVSPKGSQLKEDVDNLKKIGNDSLVAKILFEEITDSKNVYSNVCAVFLLEAIEDDVFEKTAFTFLQNSEIDDNRKFFIISLLKQKGINFDYHDVRKYINSPETIAQSGVKDFLVDAVKNPEVQIDLLDFYINISKEDRVYFLNNLTSEFQGDDLANAFSLLIQIVQDKDEQKMIAEALLETNSPYALEGLEFLKKEKLFAQYASKIDHAIKKISFANPNFKNIGIIEDSTKDKAYISFIDGNSDFSLAFSRKKENGQITTVLLTMNLMKGITSCVGFGAIAQENFNSIIERVFADSMPVNIEPEGLKLLCDYYLEKNYKTSTELPYEYIVWKKLLNDIDSNNLDVSEYLNKNLEKLNLTDAKIHKFINSKFLETWYYSYHQNEKVDEIIYKIEEKHISSIDEINKLVSETVDKYFISNEDFMAEFRSRLLILAFVAKLAKLNASSACAYSLCYENPYLKTIVTSIIDKSIYYYLSTHLLEKENNIFRQNEKTVLSKEELKALMDELEAKWV